MTPGCCNQLDDHRPEHGHDQNRGEGEQWRAGLGFDTHFGDDHLDVIMALNAFGRHTDVMLRAIHLDGRMGLLHRRHTYGVTFTTWTTYAFDRYICNLHGQSTLPNPDYGGEGRVAPHHRQLNVLHTHALRVEDAGRARPFIVRSEPWQVVDPAICRPARMLLSQRHPAYAFGSVG